MLKIKSPERRCWRHSCSTVFTVNFEQVNPGWEHHINPYHTLVSSYPPCKNHKTSGFLMFSGGMKETSGMEWANLNRYLYLKFLANDSYV